VVIALVAIAFALWWLRAQRVEAPAPPAITTGQPGMKAAPGAPVGSDADEITQPEKRELDRVLREHGSEPAAR